MVISSAVSAPNGAFDNVSRDLKVVFTGPMGAGKTTAIRAICEGEDLSTDVPISAAEAKVGGKTISGWRTMFGTWSIEVPRPWATRPPILFSR